MISRVVLNGYFRRFNEKYIAAKDIIAPRRIQTDEILLTERTFDLIIKSSEVLAA